MQLYYIRHGQSENNALWELTGSGDGRSQDPELTSAGQQQAILLASFLSQAGSGPGKWDPQNVSGFGITHLYTSLMVRAVATGAYIARSLGLPLVAWPDLHEEGGIFLDDKQTGEPVGQPGKNRGYFEKHYTGLVLPGELGEEGWWNRRPMETQPERRRRARRVLDELWRRHGNSQDRVAFVSHGGFYNHFLSILFALPCQDASPSTQPPGAMPAGRWFLMNNAAISRIDFEPQEVRLVYQNRTDFLTRELIT